MRFSLLSTALVVLASAAASQAPCHQSSDNSIFDDGISMGGPNLLLAIKTRAPLALCAARIEVWTGEGTGTNTISIWTHDAAGNKPAVSLGTSSWSMSNANGWQGATFGSPIPVAANADFWIVWGPINASQASVENRGGSPNAQQYRGSFDQGQSWNGPFQSYLWKFRIFCTTVPGQWVSFGSGCQGSNGTPALGSVGLPMAGQTMTLQVAQARPSSSAFVVIGGSSATWLGLSLPYDLTPHGAPGCSVLCSMDVVLPAPTNGLGQGSTALPIPASAGLVGQSFYAQGWIVDPANALGFVATNGGKGTVGC